MMLSAPIVIGAMVVCYIGALWRSEDGVVLAPETTVHTGACTQAFLPDQPSADNCREQVCGAGQGVAVRERQWLGSLPNCGIANAQYHQVPERQLFLVRRTFPVFGQVGPNLAGGHLGQSKLSLS